MLSRKPSSLVLNLSRVHLQQANANLDLRTAYDTAIAQYSEFIDNFAWKSRAATEHDAGRGLQRPGRPRPEKKGNPEKVLADRDMAVLYFDHRSRESSWHESPGPRSVPRGNPRPTVPRPFLESLSRLKAQADRKREAGLKAGGRKELAKKSPKGKAEIPGAIQLTNAWVDRWRSGDRRGHPPPGSRREKGDPRRVGRFGPLPVRPAPTRSRDVQNRQEVHDRVPLPGRRESPLRLLVAPSRKRPTLPNYFFSGQMAESQPARSSGFTWACAFGPAPARSDGTGRRSGCRRPAGWRFRDRPPRSRHSPAGGASRR